ncbi:sugar 3,4-ketoisomerase [Agromyces sp. SYSU T00194]|uniref:sugar 3,4-ketoisomerase n=1 Tax=Agromyces chitinivorans TaxID=3158560 RepID=UPI0033926F1E
MPSAPRPHAGPSVAVAATDALASRVRILDVDRFRDDRGTLVPIDLAALAFDVTRVFVVTAPAGAVRGGHAHRRVRQILFRAAGEIELEVRYGHERARLVLDAERPAVLLERGVWARQASPGGATTLIVLADGPFDPDEYEYEAEDPSAASTDPLP